MKKKPSIEDLAQMLRDDAKEIIAICEELEALEAIRVQSEETTRRLRVLRDK